LFEHELNLIQSRAAYRILNAAGFDITIFDPTKDDLVAIGNQAKSFDCFISLHLNACANPDVNYTAVCLHEVGAKTTSKILASKMICELVKTMRLNPYRGPFGPGVMYLPLKVLSVAEKVCKGPCVLTEAFFITSSDWSDPEGLKLAAEKAGECIGKAVVAYFTTLKGGNFSAY
jgi:N-acetylmuramoyl-L-alanine amidase